MATDSSKKLKQKGRRREILMAALASFEEFGYEVSTIEDIRRRSGASIGSIYHHFGGKTRIASALYAEGLADYQASLLLRMRRARSARTLVKAIVNHHLDWAEANPAWARYLMGMRSLKAVATIEVQLNDINRGFVREAESLIRPYVDAGEITALRFEILLAALFGPAQEFLRLWLSGRTDLGLRQARDMLAEAAWKSVRPD